MPWPGMVEGSSMTSPQEQVNVCAPYFGWMSAFMRLSGSGQKNGTENDNLKTARNQLLPVNRLAAARFASGDFEQSQGPGQVAEGDGISARAEDQPLVPLAPRVVHRQIPGLPGIGKQVTKMRRPAQGLHVRVEMRGDSS